MKFPIISSNNSIGKCAKVNEAKVVIKTHNEHKHQA